MGIPSFTQGYPPDGSTLGNTKSTMRNNLDGEFLVFSVDHQNQNETNPGYHDIIHEQTQSSVNTITGINQVFSGVPGTLLINSVATPALPANGDTQLYSLTGAGGLSQLTGSSGGINAGYSWAGGLLFQWGVVAIPNSGNINNQPFTFAIAFPRNIFNLVLTLITNSGGTSSSNNTLAYRAGSLTRTGFNWDFHGNAGSYTFFSFSAIGN